MNILKNIAGRVFALWALLIFFIIIVTLAFMAWIITIWKEPRRSRIFYRLITIWFNLFFFFIGVRRIFKGREHFKKGENYVVVCNHNTFLDVPLSSPGIPGPNKTIAKVEMARIPVFGQVYKRGSILVNRKDDRSRQRSYVQMKEVLSMGLHMCIYPEGTRNKTGEPLQRFHDGAFKLAVETGKAVIPTLIFNTKKVMPPEKAFYFWPRPIGMHFLEPVQPHNKTAQQLKEEVFAIMKAYYLQHQ